VNKALVVCLAAETFRALKLGGCVFVYASVYFLVESGWRDINKRVNKSLRYTFCSCALGRIQTHVGAPVIY